MAVRTDGTCPGLGTATRAAICLLPVGTAAPALLAQDATWPTIARLHYEGGGDWYTNPSGLPNLLAAIDARTELGVSRRPVEVRPTDSNLGDYPNLYMTGHGNVRFSEPDLKRLLRRAEGMQNSHAGASR